MAPFFVPRLFSHTIDNTTKLESDEVFESTVEYELTFTQKIFVVLEYPYSSKLGAIVLYTMSLNIVINILVFVLASLPSFRLTPIS